MYPERVRAEVAEASARPAVRVHIDVPAPRATSTTTSDRARRALVASIVGELTTQLLTSVAEDAAWRNLRALGDPSGAISAFVEATLMPLARSPPGHFADNASLSKALRQATLLADELELWPDGVAALAAMQSTPIETLLSDRAELFQSANAALTPTEARGLCALLWLRPCITALDLESSHIAPECTVLLMTSLPDRVSTLSLADTDLLCKGKDLSPVRRRCSRCMIGFDAHSESHSRDSTQLKHIFCTFLAVLRTACVRAVSMCACVQCVVSMCNLCCEHAL